MPGDADELAHAIEQLHSDPGLRAILGTSGRDFVTKQFDISSTVDQLSKNIL